MDGICNTHHDKRSLARHGEAGIRSIEPGPGRFLDLSNSSTALTNDGANKNVRDQEAKRIRLGRSGGSFTKRLVVQRTNDQTESLRKFVSWNPTLAN